jgi:L-alanine-DL-glutamate epimerase-like enolase superfamily enzyme
MHPRRAFQISRARRTEVRNVFTRIEADGIRGHGEASPNAFYSETAEAVTAKLGEAEGFIDGLQIRSVADIERAWDEVWKRVAPSRAAQCAIDLALWDWLAKREGVTVAELAWKAKPEPVKTFGTIGISAPEELDAKIDELRGFAWVKIKTGADAALDAVRRVRDELPALLAVDANCAWQAAAIPALAEDLRRLGVAFIEQPLPPAEDASLRPGAACLPIFADESCVTEEDVARVAEHFDGFNIKLVKCGGITPARRMIARGREAGRKIMVGCMLESSALIAAGAAIAQRTDFADLDGAWLLGDDVFDGWAFAGGMLTPPDAAGLGVEPHAGLFE